MLKRCKSGQHRWDDKSQAEKLQKCCNGYVAVWVPLKKDSFELDEGNLHPHNARGHAMYALVLMHESETERIAKARACEPMSHRAKSKTLIPFN